MEILLGRVTMKGINKYRERIQKLSIRVVISHCSLMMYESGDTLRKLDCIVKQSAHVQVNSNMAKKVIGELMPILPAPDKTY